MTKKVIYFTAGLTPTSPELAEIASFTEAMLTASYAVVIRNGNQPTLANLEEADYVAGTVPTDYADYDVIDTDAIPAQGLDEDQAVATNGQSVNLTDNANTSVNIALDVDGGEVLAATMPLTAKLLKSTVFFLCPAPTGTRVTGYTATIVNGAITALVGS